MHNGEMVFPGNILPSSLKVPVMSVSHSVTVLFSSVSSVFTVASTELLGAFSGMHALSSESNTIFDN